MLKRIRRRRFTVFFRFLLEADLPRTNEGQPFVNISVISDAERCLLKENKGTTSSKGL